MHTCVCKWDASVCVVHTDASFFFTLSVRDAYLRVQMGCISMRSAYGWMLIIKNIKT